MEKGGMPRGVKTESLDIQHDSGRVGAEKGLKDLRISLPTTLKPFGTYVEVAQERCTRSAKFR